MTGVYYLPLVRVITAMCEDMMRHVLEASAGIRLRQFWLSRWTPMLPPISDLITFVVREVITPEEFYRVAAYRGFSERWTKAYWEAHWRLPDIGTLKDAWWRGLITTEELNKYLVWHDYKPEPRPGISKSDLDIYRETLWRLPGAIRARWMREWGVISREEHLALVRAEGIHPDWQEKVVQAEEANLWREHITRVRTQLVRAFMLGVIDEHELASQLQALGYPPEAVVLIVQEAQWRAWLDWIDDQIKILETAYKYGTIDEVELEQELRRLGLKEWKVRVIVRKAKVKKEKGVLD